MVHRKREERGATLVEVLITMVILLVGLLGLVALQARLQVAQIDTYQRAQAAMLLNDMTQRIATNRIHAGDYKTVGAIGTGTANCDLLASTVNARAQSDLREWCNLLQGASVANGNIRLGGLVGGRGCIEEQAAGRTYRVTVAWQGLGPVQTVGDDPAKAAQCALGAYDGGDRCKNNLCRRVMVTTVHIGKLL